MIPRVLAVDLSLTRTGLCDADGPTTYAAGGDGLARLAAIRDRVLGAAADAELVAIEGYSFGSKGRAVVSIGELGGVVRLALAEAGALWLHTLALDAYGVDGGVPKAHRQALDSIAWPELEVSR